MSDERPEVVLKIHLADDDHFELYGSRHYYRPHRGGVDHYKALVTSLDGKVYCGIGPTPQAAIDAMEAERVRRHKDGP